MTPKPEEWNVVLNGAWNRAILTPKGVARKLFGLPENTTIQIEVPVDGLAPVRVIYDNIAVRVYDQRIVVESKECTEEGLGKAMLVACRALESLPETPVSAVGINLRYVVNMDNCDFAEVLTQPIEQLADLGFGISGYRLVRSFDFREGTLNFSASTTENEEIRLEFNFHRDGESDDHKAAIQWMQNAASTYKNTAESIAKRLLEAETAGVEF